MSYKSLADWEGYEAALAEKFYIHERFTKVLKSVSMGLALGPREPESLWVMVQGKSKNVDRDAFLIGMFRQRTVDTKNGYTLHRYKYASITMRFKAEWSKQNRQDQHAYNIACIEELVTWAALEIA